MSLRKIYIHLWTYSFDFALKIFVFVLFSYLIKLWYNYFQFVNYKSLMAILSLIIILLTAIFIMNKFSELVSRLSQNKFKYHHHIV